MQKLVEDLKQQSLIAFKLYANIKNAVNSSLTGISIAYKKALRADNRVLINSDDNSETKTFYIPLGHSSIENQLREEDVINTFKPVFEDEKSKRQLMMRNLSIMF